MTTQTEKPPCTQKQQFIYFPDNLTHMPRKTAVKRSETDEAKKDSTDDQVYIFKVLQSCFSAGTRRSPYREIAIPGSSTLYTFGLEILGSFDFDFDHPFGFYNNLTRYYNSTVAYELFADNPDTRADISEGVRGVKKTRIETVFTTAGQKMLFLFDYGDEWNFRVTFKGTGPAQPGIEYPCILKSVGEACPQYDYDDDEDDDEE
jgi:hypothetical protein